MRRGALGFVRARVRLTDGHLKVSPAALKVVVGCSMRLTVKLGAFVPTQIRLIFGPEMGAGPFASSR